jgi:hypothetical protein
MEGGGKQEKSGKVARKRCAGHVPLRAEQDTAGTGFWLVKRRHGNLLTDLDLVRIGDVARRGDVGIMVGDP